MEIINIIILWLHYLATVVWIGGMAFNIMVLRPSMTVIEQNERPVLGNKVLKRFIVFAWMSIVVLILTGISITFKHVAFEDILITRNCFIGQTHCCINNGSHCSLGKFHSFGEVSTFCPKA